MQANFTILRKMN